VCPDKLILADLKTPDVGGLEAKMAFDAGADMMTVIGGAPMATVESALQVAQQMGKEMLMELTGVRDIIARAKEWKQVGVQRMVYHRGWDEQTFHREWSEDDKHTVRQLIDMGFKVTVTGGITVELLPFFQDLAVSIIIAGRAIHKAKDPAASALEMRSAIARLWGAPQSTASAEVAAKAIRWGISEMGLLLTTDGRDCPGCDSPQRLCQGTITTIHCPEGIRVDDLVQAIVQLFPQRGPTGGPSQAFPGGDLWVGRSSGDAFFLDPAQLLDLSPERITDLLLATGNAVRQLGYPADVNAGVGVANRILGTAYP
jgi:3-dehydro-L-gulonate-6-phosphate decarboxylase